MAAAAARAHGARNAAEEDQAHGEGEDRQHDEAQQAAQVGLALDLTALKFTDNVMFGG